MLEAIILAGGKGTRLKAVTGDLPKPMVDINGTPFLFKLMRKLESFGCKKIVLSLGYQADYVMEQVRNQNVVKCKVEYSIETKPLGTGGALKMAASHIEGTHFIALNGDTYSDLDYGLLSKYSKANRLDIIIAALEVEDSSRYGALDIDHKSNRLISMSEKGTSGMGFINSGTYVFPKSTITEISLNEFSLETDLLSKSIAPCKVFRFNGSFIDLGIPEDYYLACEKL